MYIDAVCIKGQGKTFTCSIQVKDETETTFIPLDLNDYSVQFKVLGAPTLDAKTLIEHVITQNSEYEEYGQIYDAANGEFTFGLTADEINAIGLGDHPIALSLLNADDLTPATILTEGGLKGEFNKIKVVQV